MKKIKELTMLIICLILFSSIDVSAATLDCNEYLKSGSTGEDVLTLQQMLNNNMSCSLAEDSVFGPLTKKCVENFQAKYNLTVDGIVGPVTCNKLNTTTTTIKTQTIKSLKKNQAVVVGDLVNVRKKASINSKSITQVKVGKKVKILSKKGDWYYINVDGKTKGYIKKDLLTRDLIIVDISDQIMYFYKDGKMILETNVVTGMQNNHDTPIGAYVLPVANIQRGTTLKGSNDNGSTYNAYVEYWMPFIDNSIGFHDATWRADSEFNNARYVYDGSHGCVNMKYNDAKTLFENITKDTAVIIKK